VTSNSKPNQRFGGTNETRPVRRLLRLIKVLAVNFLVLLVLLEAGSVVAYFLKTGEFFYTRDRNRIRATRTDFQVDFDKASNETLIGFQLHPYFGYVGRPGINYGNFRLNNFGFQSPYDLPFQKTDRRQFIIGVLGGSVAMGYAQSEQTNAVLATAIHRVPGFQDRELIVLNLAGPSYKEPQQLLVLNYLLSLGQRFDAIVNIDGFNEVAISNINTRAGFAVSMPAANAVVPLIDLGDKNASPERLVLILQAVQTKQHVVATLDRLDHCRSAVCYTVNWIQEIYWQRQYQRVSQQLSELKSTNPNPTSLVWMNGMDKSKDNNQSLEEAADLWANSSRAMNDLLTKRDVPYVEFLQPNQYYTTRRQFTEAERAIAFSEGSPFRAGAEAGFPKLLSRVVGLQQSGVRLFNAVDAFDDVKEPVYVDNCCHYNAFGQKIFAEFVAPRIVSGLKAPGAK
jgi:hypothetical protein